MVGININKRTIFVYADVLYLWNVEITNIQRHGQGAGHAKEACLHSISSHCCWRQREALPEESGSECCQRQRLEPRWSHQRRACEVTGCTVHGIVYTVQTTRHFVPHCVTSPGSGTFHALRFYWFSLGSAEAVWWRRFYIWLSARPGVMCCCPPAALNSIGSLGRLACLFSCFRIFINTKSLNPGNSEQRSEHTGQQHLRCLWKLAHNLSLIWFNWCISFERPFRYHRWGYLTHVNGKFLGIFERKNAKKSIAYYDSLNRIKLEKQKIF